MSKARKSEPDTRAEIILKSCEEFYRSQLLEKLAQEVRAIEPELSKYGEAGERIRSLLRELDESPNPTAEQP